MSVARHLALLLANPQLRPAPGGAAVIACSGGLDSTVLARTLAPLLAERGHPVVLAIVDHGWDRPGIEGDVEAVRRMAGELGARFTTSRRPSAPLHVRAVGVEAAARAARRAWLHEVATAEGSEIVYLAHHRDDQIETILMRRIEGVPADRAAAMPPRNGLFCRPLLDVPRAELRTLAEGRGWSWRQDPTNEDRRFVRNRLRAEVLPSIAASTPKLLDELLKEGLVARSRATYLMERLPSLREAVVEPPDEVDGDREYTLRRTALAGAEPDLAVLLLQTLCGPSIAGGRPPARAVLQGVLQDAAALGTPARLRDLGGGWTSRTAGDQLSLRRGGLRLEGARPPSQLLVEGRMADWPGGWRIGTRRLDVDSARVKLRAPGAGTQFAVFDPSSLLGPLRVAAVGEGRTMRPFGMGGRRAVRTVLSEAGVSRPRRAGWPAVVDDSGAVLWIPGIRAADRAPLLEGSSSALLLYTTAASDPSRRTAAGPNPA